MNRTFSGLWSRVAARMAAAPPEGDKTGEAAPPVWVNRWGWRMVLALWGGLLAVFTGYRLVFYWMYHPVFAGFGAGDVALAFLHGVRFDLAVILTFTGLPVWAAFAASPWRRRRGMFWVVVLATAVVFLPVFVLMGVDLFYYQHVGRRVSFEVAAMQHDWRPMVSLVLEGYLWRTMAALAVLGGAAWAGLRWLKRMAGRPWRRVGGWAQTGQALGLLLMVGVAARGGLQGKPLTVGMAFTGGEMALGHLTLNAVFTVEQSLAASRLSRVDWLPEEEAISETRAMLGLKGPPQPAEFPLERPHPARHGGPFKKNVVIITLEGFSAFFTGELGHTHATPRFDALARQGVLYDNFYATGSRSVEGIATILTGFPALPNVSLIGTNEEQTNLESLSRILKRQGYHSFFLHGAFKGSMGFDAFALKHGFDRYIAKEDFPLEVPGVLDGAWGVWDEYTLDRLNRELESAPKPVLGFYFSLSAHDPYGLPDEKYRVFPPDNPEAKFLNAFYYVDTMLGRFFDKARGSAYWNNTVFVITGDHTQGVGVRDARQRQWIPLLVLNPGDPRFPRGKVDHTLGNQTDIAPTLLDLLDVPYQGAFLGQSLISPAVSRQMLMIYGGQAAWMDETTFMLHDLEKPLGLYDARQPGPLGRNLLEGRPLTKNQPPLFRFQAFFQTANNLLLDNRVSPLR